MDLNNNKNKIEENFSPLFNRHQYSKNVTRTCTICKFDLLPSENSLEHMIRHHGMKRLFHCQCCAYIFHGKRNMNDHVMSMKKYGTMGVSKPVIRTSNPPGWLLEPGEQHNKTSNLPSPSGNLEEDAERVLQLVRQNRRSSLSSTASSSTDSGSSVTSPATRTPESQHIPVTPLTSKVNLKILFKQSLDECVRMQNEEVSKLLKSSRYAGRDFGSLETWEKIVEEANSIIIARLTKVTDKAGIKII